MLQCSIHPLHPPRGVCCGASLFRPITPPFAFSEDKDTHFSVPLPPSVCCLFCLLQNVFGSSKSLEHHSKCYTHTLFYIFPWPSRRGRTPLSALHTHSCSECPIPRGCIHRRSTQLEGQGTPRDKGRHSGFPSHAIESERQFTQLDSFRLKKKKCWKTA